jgi:hypothetical protein
MKKSIPTIGTNAARPTNNAPHVIKAIAALEGTEEVRLNVSLPSTLHRAVKMRALEEGRTIKEVVLTYLADYSK